MKLFTDISPPWYEIPYIVSHFFLKRVTFISISIFFFISSINHTKDKTKEIAQ